MSDQAAPSAEPSSGSAEQLKAGHAPAIKVGGMRVAAARPRHTSQGEEKDKAANAEGDQAAGDDSANQAKDGKAGAESSGQGAEDEEPTAAVANRAAGEMVSGTFVPIQKAFPTEAVKNIHDKPGTHPKHEFHNHTRHEEQRTVHQPRKQ